MHTFHMQIHIVMFQNKNKTHEKYGKIQVS